MRPHYDDLLYRFDTSLTIGMMRNRVKRAEILQLDSLEGRMYDGIATDVFTNGDVRPPRSVCRVGS